MKYNASYLKSVLSYARIVPSLFGLSPRRGNLLLYITNRCNSKCLICNHWEQQPKVDMPAWMIQDLMDSKTVGKVNWLVEGGEVFCHPEIETILGILEKVNYTLFTNGLMSNSLIEAVIKHRIKSVNISLDGRRETYEKIRGVDGLYNIKYSVRGIKNLTNLQIVYTASPWNTYEDYLAVKDYCKRNRIRLMFNIYSEAAKSGKFLAEPIDERYEKISAYARYYNKWVKGEVNIPCYSSLFTVVVFPTGDVNLCVSKFNALGNLYKNSLDEIWNSRETRSHQKFNKNCNKCWVSCYRNFDIKLAMLKGDA